MNRAAAEGLAPVEGWRGRVGQVLPAPLSPPSPAHQQSMKGARERGAEHGVHMGMGVSA